MSSPEATIAVVDIAPLLAGAKSGRKTADADEILVARKLDAAAQGSGFMYVTGHGAGRATLEATLEQARRLFSLSTEAKQSMRAQSGEGVGWEPSGAQKLDEGRLGEMLELGRGVDGEAASGDLKESYIVGNPGTKSALDAQWPVLPGFKEGVEEYHSKCRDIVAALMRGFAIALGCAATRFEEDISDPFTKLRLLKYPRAGARYNSASPGCGAHTDWGALTLLLQDDVGGLEVCMPRVDAGFEPRWLPAPQLEGAILANVGDMLLRWTNGRYRSAPHRVLTPQKQGAERHSVAFFLNCNTDAIIDPAALLHNDGSSGEEEPEAPKWAPITAMDYIQERVNATYSDATSSEKTS